MKVGSRRQLLDPARVAWFGGVHPPPLAITVELGVSRRRDPASPAIVITKMQLEAGA